MTNQELIKQKAQILFSQNLTKEEIYKNLLSEGFLVDEINLFFKNISTEKEKEENPKRTIFIILIIGAVLVAAGIFSFVASNWQEMTSFVKVSIILISMILSYSLGFYFQEKRNLPKLGGALIILGVLIYGAGIFLVAQIFNIRANWPDGFILWMVGAVAMSYATKQYSLIYITMVLCLIAIFAYPPNIINSISGGAVLLTSTTVLFMALITTSLVGFFVRKKFLEQDLNFY
ncbi:MAG TPA: DUF2157 domain-containing protein [Candidatus Paceibacterota bacterium]|nr:DUF2157 domain-containing protein [Candidatus Paceibacterota bacterium]